MEQIWIAVCNRAVAAGWLVVAIALLRLLWKRGSKQIRLFFWLPVALRLLFSDFPKSAFALVPSFWVVPQQIGMMQTPAISSGIPPVDRLVNPVLAQNLSARPYASANPVQIWLAAMIWIWFGGILLLLGYSLLSYVRLRLRTRDAVLVRQTGARRPVSIYQSEKITAPFVVGFLRPRIYVPSSLPEASYRYVLAHETEHIRHQDHRLKAIAWLFMILYWPFPLLWLGWFLFCKDLELACDERVVRQFNPQERCRYSEVLLDAGMPKTHGLPCPLAFGASDVKTRVKNVLQYRPPTIRTAVAAAGILLLLAAAFLTAPQEKIVLPDPDDILHVELRIVSESEDKSLVIDDADWNARLLSAVSGARKTQRPSVQDAPSLEALDGRSYTSLTLRKTDGAALTYYLYAVGGRYYLEQPYTGIYRTNADCPDLVGSYIAGEADGWLSISYSLHRLEQGREAAQALSLSQTQADVCRQVVDFYVQKKTSPTSLTLELRRQLGDAALQENDAHPGQPARPQTGQTTYDREAVPIETLGQCYRLDRQITGNATLHSLYLYEADGMAYIQGSDPGAFCLDPSLYDALVNFFTAQP